MFSLWTDYQRLAPPLLVWLEVYSDQSPFSSKAALCLCSLCLIVLFYLHLVQIYVHHLLCRLVPSVSQSLRYQITSTWWAAACDAPQDVFQKGLRSYFTVSGLRRRRVLIKIQIPCIDCVIRPVQPGPGVSIQPVIYDHFQEKSFCVIIWGNRGWVSVILLDLFCCSGGGGEAKRTATPKPLRGEIFSSKKLLWSRRFHWKVNQMEQQTPQTHMLQTEAAACGSLCLTLLTGSCF